MTPLRFAWFGVGFWSKFQLAGWSEVDGAFFVAVCDPNRSKAKSLSQEHGIAAVH